jgi:signal transduction histidine kinase
MAGLRLRTQLLIATLLIICVLTGGLLLIVRHSVRSEIANQVHESTTASLRAFENVQQEHDVELSRTAALLADLPTLKAVMTTEHALTIQDASEPFWKLAGSDLFLLASPDREVLGFHTATRGWTASVAEENLNRSVKSGQDSAWWYANDQLYRVFLQSITAGTDADQRQLGILAVGYRVNSKVAQQLATIAGSQIALTAKNKIIASTLSPREEVELQGVIDGDVVEPGASPLEVKLGTGEYQAAAILIHAGPPVPVTCYALVSEQPANAFIRRLNRIIFVLGGSALLLGGILLSFVSRTITRPLENLVSGVRALAAGDYAYSITPHGSSEVAELGEAFSRMRDELLLSQQRALAAERVAALGRAASSISHDLRHYLAAVVANAEFLHEADKLKMNKDEVYEEIQTASNQMLDLLDSLRELAKESTTISPVPASLELTLHHAADAVLLVPEMRSRKIFIDTTGEMDGSFDPKKLERAFFNLLLNACEATRQDGGRISVTIVSSADYFHVRISDNGSGIPASIRASLFDPFVSSGKANGTGLGLAIVSRILSDHEGSVEVESTSEIGTVFVVRLPRFASGRPAVPLAVS